MLFLQKQMIKLKRFIDGKFYSNVDGNIIYAPFDMLFFKTKLTKIYNIFDNPFHKNIHYSVKIKDFIINKDWEILKENN